MTLYVDRYERRNSNDIDNESLDDFYSQKVNNKFNRNQKEKKIHRLQNIPNKFRMEFNR